MISSAFHAGIYVPLYNGLIWLLSLSPFIDVGIAVVLLTVVVKLILLPLGLKAARTQLLMRELEAPLKEIRERYKSSREEQAKRTLELYREKGVNPFSSILVLFIQLPVIFGLYWVFYKGGLPSITTEELYSFVTAPLSVNMHFLGLVDMGMKSLPLAFLAGASQFFQARIALPKLEPRNADATFQEDFARSMQIQMKYVLPGIVGVVAYATASAIALYWITSNIFAIGQEFYVKKRLAREGIIK